MRLLRLDQTFTESDGIALEFLNDTGATLPILYYDDVYKLLGLEDIPLLEQSHHFGANTSVRSAEGVVTRKESIFLQCQVGCYQPEDPFVFILTGRHGCNGFPLMQKFGILLVNPASEGRSLI